MTNFQPNPAKSQLGWLTPERSVLVLPVLGGVLLAGVIAIGALTPLLVTIRDQKAKLDALLFQQRELPALKQRLQGLSRQQQATQQQQDLLLGLLAGTNELTTFLAELDQLAQTAGVSIETTELGAIERYVAPVDPDDDGSTVATLEVATSDPLLHPSLEKRSANLNVRGSYISVLSFLQALESLQVFVIISDLQIDAERRASPDSDDKAAVTRMSLVLTAYGKNAE
jgi:type IV pilus assembly protein PilO